ncbi:hypothetical protein M1P56_09805 [Streptomyces sp. HU2014]|uniref:hypothetical protein n=1 Tax=Streptomyces sp. HU2014 TaxID=2939414 RepID=UPI00201059B2|nr:hypothetical protein [Streptomyces sp. HU2014]UQI44620.1 hypothetical protein M1P56_09805 [Streptomyces sp. HU2014]
MQAELRARLATLSVGDHVKAVGSDTRGREVTRVGDLLAPPAEVTAQRNGRKTPGFRLFVGLAGTNPSERSTWVTLFPDYGTVEQADAPQPGEWRNTELRYVPGIRTADGRRTVLFGGKGGKRSDKPSQSTLVKIRYTESGRYELVDANSGDVVHTTALQGQIWWALAPAEPDAQPAVEHVDEPTDAAEAPQPTALSLVPDTLMDEDDHSDLGNAVSHARTGAIVGYLREPRGGQDWKWTPIDQVGRV